MADFFDQLIAGAGQAPPETDSSWAQQQAMMELIRRRLAEQNQLNPIAESTAARTASSHERAPGAPPLVTENITSTTPPGTSYDGNHRTVLSNEPDQPIAPDMARPRPNSSTVAPQTAAPAVGPAPRVDIMRPADGQGQSGNRQPNMMERLSALGRGYNQGGLIGGIGDAFGVADRSAETENMTVHALTQRGLDLTTATAVARNPQLLNTLAPTLLGGGRDWDMQTIFDGQGRRQVVAVNKRNPTQVLPIGGPQNDPLEQQITRDQVRADNSEMQKLRANAQRASEIAQGIGRMRELRRGVSYEGGVLTGARTTLGRVLPDTPDGFPGLPWVPSQAEAGRAEALESEATRMQQNVRGIGEGAVSNYERELFARAAPGMGMSDEGAAHVLDGWEAAARRTQERVKFFEAWRAQHRTLSGASAAWDRYTEENRIIDADDKGNLRINRGNIGNWQGYVQPREGAGRQNDPPAATTGPATEERTPAPPRTPIPPAERESILNNAREALRKGAPRDAVIRRLRDNGIDPAGL